MCVCILYKRHLRCNGLKVLSDQWQYYVNILICSYSASLHTGSVNDFFPRLHCFIVCLRQLIDLLQLVHLKICFAFSHQLIVSALLDDSTIRYYTNHVRVLHSR